MISKEDDKEIEDMPLHPDDKKSSVQGRVILRPELTEFAELMEEKLRGNDDKSSWKGMHIDKLLARLKEEVEELTKEIETISTIGRAAKIRSECADVANFAMMISDITKGAL